MQFRTITSNANEKRLKLVNQELQRQRNQQILEVLRPRIGLRFQQILVLNKQKHPPQMPQCVKWVIQVF